MTLLNAIKEIKFRKETNDIAYQYSSKNPEEQKKYEIQAEVYKRVLDILGEVDSL